MESVEKIAEVVLYEGYLLYPYTRSTLKNQQRWTFGGVYPESTGGNDPWLMQTQCLLLGNADAEVEVKVRFLHIVDRTVLRGTGDTRTPVPELRVGEQVYRPWEEAAERTVLMSTMRLGNLLGEGRSVAVDIPGGSKEERLVDPSGETVGTLLREWRPLLGAVEVAAQLLQDSCYRLTVKIVNTNVPTGWSVERPSVADGKGKRADHPDGRRYERKDVLRETFISTHTILRAHGGEFVSMLETPPAYAEAAARCDNIKTWPVLAGAPGERHTVLSSPIILYDYPQISPESHGDFFDATEIDELLVLSVMTLTDEEKQEMRESDERGREILERTESLTPEQIAGLHGTIRSFQTLRQEDP